MAPSRTEASGSRPQSHAGLSGGSRVPPTPCPLQGRDEGVCQGRKRAGRVGDPSLTWPPLLAVAPTARAVTAELGPPAPQRRQEGGLGPAPSARQPWAATRRTRPLRKGPCRVPTAPCLPSTAAFSRSGGALGWGKGGSAGSQWCTQAGLGVPWGLGGLRPTLRRGIRGYRDAPSPGRYRVSLPGDKVGSTPAAPGAEGPPS